MTEHTFTWPELDAAPPDPDAIRDQARKQGYDQGYSEGHAAGLAQAASDIESFRGSVSEAVTALTEVRIRLEATQLVRLGGLMLLSLIHI